MKITPRELAELTDREQDQMRRWTHDVLAREYASRRRKEIRAAIDMEEVENDPRRVHY